MDELREPGGRLSHGLFLQGGIMRALVFLLAAVGLSGCYSYVPAEFGGPTRGAAVRVHLDPPVPVSIGDVAVQHTVAVSGEVVSWDPSHLVISAKTLLSISNQDYLGGGYTVRLPQSALARIEARRLSRWRTALVTGGIIAGGVFLGIIAQEGFGGEGGGGGGGKTK